ncbi:MAG: FtsX-like permease family protein, partial [Polyangiaceae bacterium]
THELGVRIALGAGGSDILRLIVGGGIRLVLVGLVVGSGLALMLGKVIASMLYHTSAGDPAVFLGVGATILGVAVLACAIPAWRATRADPLVSLRAE